MTLKIAILGGGIIGFSCAVKISEFYKNLAQVTVISDDFTPNTTGDGSAGLWGPFLLSETDKEDIIKWSKETHEFLYNLWISDKAGEAGICLIPVIRVTTLPDDFDTFWRYIVYGCTNLSSEHLKILSKECGRNFTNGVSFVTFTSEPTKLLPYLMKRFKNSNGNIQKMKIDKLKEFVNSTDYDIIINCLGLSAKYVVPDNEMYSIRGQVTRIEAPWIYLTFLDESDDGNYIIPNCNSVVLGGTHQVNDYNTTPNQSDSSFIHDGCAKIIPGLVNAKRIKEWVGLRPGRPKIRLEKELLDNGKVIIHNYGHGGSGVTLAWGCASTVLDIINERKNKL